MCIKTISGKYAGQDNNPPSVLRHLTLRLLGVYVALHHPQPCSTGVGRFIASSTIFRGFSAPSLPRRPYHIINIWWRPCRFCTVAWGIAPAHQGPVATERAVFPQAKGPWAAILACTSLVNLKRLYS